MKKFLTILLFIASVVFSTPLVHAQLNQSTGILDSTVGPKTKAGLQGDLPTTAATIIKLALSLVGSIFLFLVIYAGILWMTAAGDGEKVQNAVKIIRAALVGLIIIMLAYAVTYFVTSRLASGVTRVEIARNLS